MANSHFFYIHKTLDNARNDYKVGITKTPYSKVRSIQRLRSSLFSLAHVFFGDPADIVTLETLIKKSEYIHNENGAQEIVRMPVKNLLFLISTIISKYKLNIKEIHLNKPYSARKSTDCPLGLMSEVNADGLLADIYNYLDFNNTNKLKETDFHWWERDTNALNKIGKRKSKTLKPEVDLALFDTLFV